MINAIKAFVDITETDAGDLVFVNMMKPIIDDAMLTIFNEIGQAWV